MRILSKLVKNLCRILNVFEVADWPLLPPAKHPKPLAADKNNPREMLAGQKASLLVLSQNWDQVLCWNPEPPPAGPYMRTCCSSVVQSHWNIVKKKGGMPKHRAPRGLKTAASKCREIRCVGTYSVAWFQLCTPQYPLDSDAFIGQLTLKGGGLSCGHRHILQRPHQADHSGFRLWRRHG